MERIMEAAVDMGARRAGHVMLRLPYEVKDLFRPPGIAGAQMKLGF
jgi:hypothetical protein